MAIAMYFNPPSFNAAQYDDVDAALEEAGARTPAARTLHVCFGEGCDFAPDCSIIDRVATLNGFFPLNTIYVDKARIDGDTLKPVSLYFREEPWTPEEMFHPSTHETFTI